MEDEGSRGGLSPGQAPGGLLHHLHRGDFKGFSGCERITGGQTPQMPSSEAIDPALVSIVASVIMINGTSMNNAQSALQCSSKRIDSNIVPAHKPTEHTS